jgi:twitching motility protein PilT
MKRQATPALSADQLELMLLSVMPERNRAEWKETGDSDFAYEIRGLARFRVNAARDRKGPMAVFRVIPEQVVSVDQLRLSKEVQQLCQLTKGLVLITGPTGSGKSTTLCAMIDLINRTRTDHIITIEDPIEFVHENKKCVITQRQVGSHTETFKSALRAALREDPDIVLVGEIREGKTFQIPSIIQTSKQLGMVTLNDALLELVEKKEISPDEAYTRSAEKAGLAASLKSKGHKLTLTA